MIDEDFIRELAEALFPDELPTLSDLLGTLIRKIQQEHNGAFPAKVVAVYPAVGTEPAKVDVQSGFMYRAARDDEEFEHKTIRGVVLMPMGTKKFGVSIPIEVGDEGFVFVVDRAMNPWLEAQGAPVFPGTDRIRDPGDSVFFPVAVHAPITQRTDAITIGLADGTSQVAVTETGGVELNSKNVTIGSATAQQAQVLGDLLKTAMSAITVPTPMGPSGTPINSPTFNTFLSALHKIDS